MPKQVLSGTVDEQCLFLYDLAKTKMAEGNYTGAVHALREVVKHRPKFRDAAALLTEAKQKKNEHRNLALMGFAGAVVFIGLGRLFEAPSDWVFLALAVIGAVVGFLLGQTFLLRRTRSNSRVRSSAE
jgi:hypothetical protein